MYLLAVVLGAFAVLVIGRMAMVARAIANQRHLQLSPLAGGEESAAYEHAMQSVDAKLLESSGFTLEGAFQLTGAPVPLHSIVWRSAGLHTHFVVVTSPQMDDASSSYLTLVRESPPTSVSTGASPEVHAIPCPRTSYAQSFTGLDSVEMLSRHLSAVDAVSKKYGVTSLPPMRSYLELYQESKHRNVRYVLSRPWLLLIVLRRHVHGVGKLHDRAITDTL